MRIKNLLCFMVVAGTVYFGAHAHADDFNKDIVISNAWVQAMPPSQTTSAAYMDIANNTQKEMVLDSASSDIAGVTEIHEMSEINGIMHMARIKNLPIPSQGKVTLQPGGFHIMLINLKKPANAGDIVLIILHFHNGDNIIVKADVRDQ